jgi:hypothetical protein
MAEKYFTLISNNITQGLILALLFFFAFVFHRYVIPEIVMDYLKTGIRPQNKKNIAKHYFTHFLWSIISVSIVFFFLLIAYEGISRGGVIFPIKYLIAFFFISLVSYMTTVINETKKRLKELDGNRIRVQNLINRNFFATIDYVKYNFKNVNAVPCSKKDETYVRVMGFREDEEGEKVNYQWDFKSKNNLGDAICDSIKITGSPDAIKRILEKESVEGLCIYGDLNKKDINAIAWYNKENSSEYLLTEILAVKEIIWILQIEFCTDFSIPSKNPISLLQFEESFLLKNFTTIF